MARKKKMTEPLPEINKKREWGVEVGGWSLLLLALLFLLSLISDFVPQQKNVLGPYLGVWLANFLTRLFGRLPVLLLIVSLGFTGLRVLNFGAHFKKWALWSLNYAFLLAILLTINHLSKASFVLEDFEGSGGVVANFLIHFLFKPLFGKSTLGPYLLMGSLLYFQTLWITGWKPSVWIQEYLRKRRDSKIPGQKWWRRSELSPAQELIRRKRAKEKGDFDENDVQEAAYELKKIEVKKDNKYKKEEKLKEKVLTQEESNAELFEAVDDDFDFANKPSNPMELRKWRDRKADFERVKELNEWEDRQGEGLDIQGILTREEEIPEVVEQKEVQVEPEIELPKSEKKTAVMPKISMESDPLEGANTYRPNYFEKYAIPLPQNVFDNTPLQKLDFGEGELRAQSDQLEAQLANFRVKGKVVAITTGPVITRFEVDLAPGVKVSKVAGLSDDLALALKAKSVRILAPIPGKSAVGIEIPNPSSHIVYCRDILMHENFKGDADMIPIALGKDIGGMPYVMNLARAPHLLIAGQTGSGKSVCINTIMASILCSKTPEELRMILVDPKVVELKPYEAIPHLLHPVVTDPETAVQALQWGCWEMDRRYDVLARAKVRNLAGFNAKFEKNLLVDLVDPEDHRKMPFIIIVIDELADLMMVAGKEVEVSIARIAQKARAVGIHLILATQRPSTNVITGTIKANLPTRIAFKVASHIDARTILDKAGAEKLLGRGDMLFKSIEDPEAVRVHGAFVTDEEAESLANSCAKQNVNFPQLESFDINGGDSEMEDDVGPRDDKFNEAAELVVHVGTASASALQRRLGVGFARAGRLIDQLEAAGIVGRSRGSKPREVLMDETQLQSFLSGDLDKIILD